MKIAIISPDAIPLPILSLNLSEEIKNKCLRATALGVRAWSIAEQVSKKHDVTLFIPDINYNPILKIDYNKLFCKLETYSYELTLQRFEKSLQSQLQQFDAIIIQGNSGSCFLNCISLPARTKVIVDGWITPTFEVFFAIDHYSEEYQSMYWDNFMSQYNSLLKRADIILYNTDPQYYYYINSLFQLKKFNWFKNNCKQLIKCTFGINLHNKVIKNTNKNKLKLLWFGPVYPWHCYEELIEVVSKNKEIELDFVAIRHPRYNRIYNTIYKKIFNNIQYNNIKIIEDYQDNREELFKNYDAQIMFSKESFLEKFIFSARVMDSLSFGLPVFLNKENPIFNLMNNIKDSIYPIQKENLTCTLNYYAKYRDELKVSDESFSFIQNNYSWEETCKDLINYLEIL